MTVEYVTTVATNRLTQVQNAVDAQATHGWLRLQDNLGNTLSSLPLSLPSGSVSGRVYTITTPITDFSTALSGTAVSGILQDGNSNNVATGLTVGLSGSGADIILTSTQIVAGQALSITTATITTP